MSKMKGSNHAEGLASRAMSGAPLKGGAGEPAKNNTTTPLDNVGCPDRDNCTPPSPPPSDGLADLAAA